NQDAGSIASCSTGTDDSTHRMLSTPEPQRCIVRPKSAQMARSAQLPPSYPASAQLPSHSSPGSPATQGTPASSSFFSDDTLHSSPDPAYSPQGSDHKPPKPPGKIMRLLKRAGSSRGNLVAPEPHVSPFTNLFQELSVEASRPGSAGLKGVPPRTPSRGNSRQPSRRTSESGDNPEGLASAALGMLGGLLRRVSSSGGAAPTASGLLRRLSSGGRNKVHMEPLPLEPAIPLASSSEHIEVPRSRLATELPYTSPYPLSSPTLGKKQRTATAQPRTAKPANRLRGGAVAQARSMQAPAAAHRWPPRLGPTNHRFQKRNGDLAALCQAYPSLEARETKLSRKHPHPRVPLVDRHGGIAMVDIATSPRSAAYGRSATMLLKFPSASVSQGRAPRARLQVFGSRTYHRSDSLVPLKRYNHECVMVVCCSLPRFWRGYVGTWHINPHTPGPAHKIIHGLRSFKWRGVAAVRRAAVCSVQAPCLPQRRQQQQPRQAAASSSSSKQLAAGRQQQQQPPLSPHPPGLCVAAWLLLLQTPAVRCWTRCAFMTAEKPPAKQRDLDQLYQAGTGGEGPGGWGAGAKAAEARGGGAQGPAPQQGQQVQQPTCPAPYFHVQQPARQPACPPCRAPRLVSWLCPPPLLAAGQHLLRPLKPPAGPAGGGGWRLSDDATLAPAGSGRGRLRPGPLCPACCGPGVQALTRPSCEQLPRQRPESCRGLRAHGAWSSSSGWVLKQRQGRDGEYRWSASVSYDRDTGDLVRVVAVQEAYTDIKPSTCNVLTLASAKVHEPRDWCADRRFWSRDASESGCRPAARAECAECQWISSSGKMNSWSKQRTP
ncbi:hypothetical protein QJQ45_027292, partial [Haematococcus lacustris]